MGLFPSQLEAGRSKLLDVYSRYTLILFMSSNFPRANELMNGNALTGFISVHSKVLAVRT